MDISTRAVLVLDKNFMPCYVTNLKHAFSLLFRDVAYVIDENFYLYDIWKWMKEEPKDGEEHIKLVRGKMKIPKAILVNGYIKHNTKPKISRLAIFLRDNFTCQYCGKKMNSKRLTVDHIIPKSRGGKTEWTNVVTACITCNTEKGDMTPKEAGMKLLKDPKPPKVSILVSKKISFEFETMWEMFIPK